MPQQPDTEVLRDSMTREVTNDAYAIAGQIFKVPDGDVARVSNEQLDERYRQALQSNQRDYLMAEAGRDPNQFLAAMQRLGVQMPAGEEIQPDPPLPKAAKSNAPIPKPPESAVQELYPAPKAVPPPAPPLPPMTLPPSPAATPPAPPPPAAMPIPPAATPPY
jgi:hypothetical protein